MANLPISGLTASAANLAATDVSPFVQVTGVGPVKMTGLQLAGGLLGSTTFNGSTVTTSSPVLNLTQTWNDGAVTFTGLKFNATDTASASGSLLLDIGTGGGSYTSRFNVTKGGQGTFSGNVITGGIYHAPSSITGWFLSGSLMYGYVAGGQAYTLNSVGMDIASTSGRYSISSDLILSRAAAATLQLGAADTTGTTAPTAQFLRVQSWSSSTNNNQTGANFTIQGSRGTGAGAGGSIIFQVAPAGSSGTAQNVYSTALTINSNGKATFTPTVNSTSTFEITNLAGSIIVEVDSTNRRFNAGGSGGAFSVSTSTGATTLYNAAYFGWQDGATAASGSTDVRLYRDAASTLALRNGNSTGAAQRFNVYNTYTSSTNYETFKVDWITTANTCLIGTEKGSGGGTARALALQTDGTTRLTIGTAGGASISGVLTSPVGNDAPAFLVQSNIGAGNGVSLSVTEVNDGTVGAGISANLNVGGAVSSGNRLGYYFFGGATNNANSISRSAGIASFATQNWSGTQSASDLRFYTTANTTTSRTERWKIENDGMFLASADNTYDIGASATASRPRNIYVGTTLTLGDAANIVAQTTTGTKIGTATSQKIGFWNATPIVQPTTGVAAATVAATGVGDVVAASTTFDGYTIPQIVKAMRNAGLLA